MFSIQPDPSIHDEPVDDSSYLFPESNLLLPLHNEDTDVGLGLKENGTVPFPNLDNILYEPYNESGPSSVQFNDLIDVSEAGASHLSSKDDGDFTASSSNGDMSISDKDGMINSHYWREGSSHSQNGKAKASPRSRTSPKDHPSLLNQPTSTTHRKLKLIVRESPLSKPENQLHAFDQFNESTVMSPTKESKRIKTSSTPEASHIQDIQQSGTPSTRSYNRKYTPEVRPRSSIPSDIPTHEFAHQCIVAAYSSRLSPFALHKNEHELLKDHITHAQVTVYLNIRNAILRVWARNALVYVTREEALGCARESRHFLMAEVAYHWLIRRGYINHGCLELPSSAGPIPRIKATSRRRTIIVVGAGVSGLGCARQLQGLFLQYGYKFTNLGEKPPRVVVLEGRERIGGRVYSHPLRKQQSELLPDNLRCTAEMGAQIVTGFQSGNPLNTVIRGQLGLHCYPLKDNTILYDHDGVPINRQHDIQVESLYNDILERASAYRNQPAAIETVEGDKDLIYWAKDPTNEGTKVLSELDGSETAVTLTGTNRRGDKNMTENVAGRGYVVSAGQKTLKPAAEAARSLGWELKPGVTETQSVDLEPYIKAAIYPTLGDTMDEAIRQYQDLIQLTPKELRLLNWHHANLEYANAANVNRLSLSNWDQDLGNEFEGQHCEIIGGYTQVPRGLWLTPTPLDVRFRRDVRVVRRLIGGGPDDDQVSVECANGEVFEGDMAVLTTSLGVLKAGSIRFEPPLPDWKVGAIERLGFGLLNKVVLVFEQSFWEDHRDMFGLLNDDESGTHSLDTKHYGAGRGRFYLFWNRTRQSGRPMLVALMAGDAAHQAEQVDDGSLVDGVMIKLRSIFAPRIVPEPSETIISRWKNDPFVRGSYSYVGPQSVPGDYDAMAEPVGALHFAGEATCGTHPATVHGAYLSGLRAASDVIDTLLGSVNVPHPLVQRKTKVDASSIVPPHGTVKSQVEEAVIQPDSRSVRARDEDYEVSIIGAILEQIGERPIRPGKAGVNPFLLYTKDYWYICKAECDKARQKATGAESAKASKVEIRTALGRMWRTASDEIRKPYLEVTDSAKEASAVNMAVYKERVATWDREASRIRKEYVEKNPPQSSRPYVPYSKAASDSKPSDR